MSEMASVVEQHHHSQQQQQQQFSTSTGSNTGSTSSSTSSDKLCCKECGLNFDSSSSLEVHLQYHQEALMSRWASQSSQSQSQQQHTNSTDAESNNNNNVNKPGSVQVKRESVSAPADSSESSTTNNQSRPPSEGPTSTHNFVHHHYGSSMYADQQQQYMLSQQQQQHGEQTHYILPHHFSPERADTETNTSRSSYQHRYHPYQHPSQMFSSGNQDGSNQQQRTNSVSSTSPRSPPLQCDKCGAVYEDLALLSEHARSAHPASSPIITCNSSSAFQQPTQSQAQTAQYQQLAAASPSQQQQQQQVVTQSQQQSQAQTQQQQQQQLQHASPTSQAHQPGYDFSTGMKEPKQEPEEQAEILDLDSHKVQTHRYEEEFMRIQQQHQQEMHLQMQQQVIQQQQHQQQQQQQQQRGGSHSVNSMLSWAPVTQSHEYHTGPPSMNPMESVSPSIPDQFMRGQLQPPPAVVVPGPVPPQQQHMPPVESPRLPGSPIITSTQSIPVMPMGPAGLMQQNPKPPPINGNQSWKSNEARRPKTYNCTACNKWFTSSGHLKRHYNTTLHKNAVKQSNQPDPANQPISAHHHPARDANPGTGRGATSRTSPELPSSSSPPNLMAGPSGEATRGLLHTPTNSTPMFNSSSNGNNSNSSSNNSNSSNEALHIKQEVLQSQQQQPMQTILASNLLYHASAPATSPMGSQLHQQQQPGHLSHPHHHHQQQQQQQQQMDLPGQHHLPMGSPSQIGSGVHHPMSSPMSPMHQSPHPGHMSSPTPMGPSSTTNNHHPHHHQQHPMNSPSPTTMGPGGGLMGQMGPSPPPSGHMMGGTTMPHQPYPNALPPHVTAITSTLGLLESITNTLTTTGNPSSADHADQQEMLPGFGTFSNHHQQYQHPQQKMLPSFMQFGGVANGFIAGQSHPAANVGGLSPEENMPPPDSKSPFQPPPGYDLYHQQQQQQQQPQRYDIYNLSQSANAGQQTMHHQLTQGAPQSINASSNEQQQQSSLRETNNNLPAKGELNTNKIIQMPVKKPRGRKPSAAPATTKDNQVTSTGSNYISENGLHKCIECDKMFNKACYLTQHNKSFHSGDKPFKCGQCGKRFPLEYLHAEHLQKHAGEKPYKCEICPKQFNHKTDLRRHLCLHTGEKPYACDNCGKGFIRKDHMMKHVETHKRKANNHKLHLRA